MKKLIIRLGLLMALPLMALQVNAADYETKKAAALARAAEAKTAAAQNLSEWTKDWMQYLPDDVYVAHVSIPGSHDTATANNVTFASSSQAQSVDIPAQLSGGVRAFDIRPGTKGGGIFSSATLNCNHGSATTGWSMDAAFQTLTNYLKDHPTEFFVIHLFKSNAENASTNKFGSLWDTFYDKYKSYFVDFDPNLKVKDVRGKIVFLCREQLHFLNIPSEGKLYAWPSDEEKWDGGRTSVMSPKNPDMRGVIRVSDVSSPKNDDIFNNKKDGITNLYNWCSTQRTPHDCLTNDGYYQPDWSLTFTSGEYGGAGSGRTGYVNMANRLNGYYTDLINNSAHKGPCGIVLSDWVLTDSYSGTAVYGVNLIPSIAKNNFEYIADYVVDDEFVNKPATVEKIWDESKEYFVRNVGTGDFLASGAWWGTRAVTAAHGIKVIPKTDDWNNHYFRTNLSNNGLGSNGTLGVDTYVDNFFFPQYLGIKNVGDNKYVFTIQGGDNAKALGANPDFWDQFQRDGSSHIVDPLARNENDPMQQWEVISVDDYYQQQIAKASMDNGSDISFVITGGRFFGNDSENNEWTFTGGGNASKENPGVGPNDSQRLLRIRTYNTANNWTLKKEVKNLPQGVYTLKWKAYCADVDNIKMTVNSMDVSSQLKKGNLKAATDINRDEVGAEMASDDFTCSIEKFEINDGDLIINLSRAAAGTLTDFFLDDFELTYYGIDYEKTYPILYRTIKDAKRRLYITSDDEVPEWLQEYIDNMKAFAYPKEDGGAAPAEQIYLKLRALTLEEYETNPDLLNFTNVLINAGFETGTMMGWETSYEGDQGADTGVRPASSDEYAMENSYNSYLFHTSQSGRGTILSQTIPGPAAGGLPAGQYHITAQAANAQNGWMYIDVNGQKSEAIPVKSPAGISELIDFTFSVAENTESITISFMGGNADQSFDDFGGSWYQLDNVRLERLGEKDMCPFFLRLRKAITRANEIAAITFADAPEYLEMWRTNVFLKKIDDLVKEHEKNHSNDDTLDGSNGIAEMTELFAELANVATSQTKTGSNMSAAIRNNSFELGDLTYWETKAAPEADALVTTGEGEYAIAANSEDATVKKDLDYFYHAKHDDGETIHAYPIYQTINNLPVGYYKLTAFVASTSGNKLVLAANDDYTIHNVTKNDEFEKVEVEFEITPEQHANGGIMKLGLYPISDGNFAGQTEAQADTKGPWYAIDNFDLRLVGRDVTIEWEMETDTHGTIILPFDVASKTLEDYGLTIHSVFEEVDDPNAVDANYRLVKTQQENVFHANTPYLVIREEVAKPEAQSKKSLRAAAPEDGIYRFTGKTSNEEYNYSPEGNLLIGTLVEIKAEADQHHLSQDTEGNIEFKLHEKGVNHPTVEPYHAYIKFEADAPEAKVVDIFLEDPTHSLTWTMEGQYYGTIILPFEAEIPEGMTAYTITGLKEVTDMPNTEDETYQLLEIEEVTTGHFAANTTYMVILDSVNEPETPEEPEVTPESYKVATRDAATTPTVTKHVFTGQAIYDQTSYPTGLLTGVHQSTTADGYQLYEDGKTAGFASNRDIAVAPNHAYIDANHELNPQATYLLLAAPQADTESGVKEILTNSGTVDIYTLQGTRVAHDVIPADGLRDLQPGIYILRSDKVSVKVIKK